jgi:hypothetical protein
VRVQWQAGADGERVNVRQCRSDGCACGRCSASLPATAPNNRREAPQRRTSDRHSQTLDVSRALALPALTSHTRSPVRMCWTVYNVLPDRWEPGVGVVP